MIKAIIIGNLTADPVLRTTPQGIDVCTFAVGANRRGGENAEYFNVSAWRQLGVSCSRYLTKGRKVCVIGEFGARAYNDKTGKAHASIDITADEVEFLSTRQPEAEAGSAPDMPGWENVSDAELPFEEA